MVALLLFSMAVRELSGRFRFPDFEAGRVTLGVANWSRCVCDACRAVLGMLSVNARGGASDGVARVRKYVWSAVVDWRFFGDAGEELPSWGKRRRGSGDLVFESGEKVQSNMGLRWLRHGFRWSVCRSYMNGRMIMSRRQAGLSTTIPPGGVVLL